MKFNCQRFTNNGFHFFYITLKIPNVFIFDILIILIKFNLIQFTINFNSWQVLLMQKYESHVHNIPKEINTTKSI